MNSAMHKRRHRLNALALVVSAAWGLSAWALPQGATVVNGQVSISQPAAGTQMINASNGAIINWKQFSIGAGEATQFIQPSSTSAVLNRVVGPDVSNLLGQLKANGQVFLINPHGIVIGGAARIDTNSFVASTLDIADADFLAGKLRFFAGSGAGRVHNDGVISAGPGGRIALIAPDIENSGIIQAPGGQILLAAGRKLEIASMDLDGVTFEIQAPTDSVLNLGKLLAENGAVSAFAGTLRHSGEIRASRLMQDSDGSVVLAGSNKLTLTADSSTRADGISGGSIVLQSVSGTARVSGEVSATGSSGTGGDIRALGERVAVEAGGRIDTSGSAGGGQILIGGDFQGRNPGVQNAERVHVAAGAQLRADATHEGDGGRVIVWADQDTRYHGSLSALGGAVGGNGGFAEVSGKNNLLFNGSADLRAPAGLSGTLLLDPLDLIVSLTSGILPTVVDEFTDFPGNVATVSPTALAAVGGNVVLQAQRDIYIKDAIALTAAGAGITVTAGGEFFEAGSIFNNAGIGTNAGAVTLRAAAIQGAGGIGSSGGAVDLLTAGALNYSGAIRSVGGAVTLASQNGSVSNADVDAGSGTIQVTGPSISGGSYFTTGTANLNATDGRLGQSFERIPVSAGTINLMATDRIYADVTSTDRVNATSSGSQVHISNSGSGPLRLGSLTGSTGLFVRSSSGMVQADGGVLTSPFISLETNGSLAAAGSQAAPLVIAAPTALVQPEIQVFDMTAPVHLAFAGGPTLGRLSLDGSVAALGGSTVAFGGTANLTSLSLAANQGVLDVSATSTGGLARGFELNVNDGAINAAILTLPEAPVDLRASGAITLGTMTGDSLSIQARGAVTVGSATTTGFSGINISTQACVNGTTACELQSPVTADTLTAGGGGDVRVSTFDNGNVTITSLSAGDDASIQAGASYRTAPFSANFFTNQPTINNILLGTVVSAGQTTVNNYGQGNIAITSLSAGDSVNVNAGVTFSPSAFTSQKTSNSISIGNMDPVGAFNGFHITNNGIGDISVSGAVDRSSSGDIALSAGAGSVTALGALTARDSINVTAAGAGAVTLGQLVSGTVNSNGNVTVVAAGDLSFVSIHSTAFSANSGNVTISSGNGSVKTTADNAAADIVASGNVTVGANAATGGVIGNTAFANPLDIRAGSAKVVTLTAGRDIGATGKAVTVDADGTLNVTSSGGQFHVAATDGITEKSLSTIRLSASATGIGAGNAATFTSLDLDVTGNSDGNTITIGDLIRADGILNELQFSATGTSALVFGDVDLATSGLNRLTLGATNGLIQMLPLSNALDAGTITLAGGAGGVTSGALTARSVRVSGADLSTGPITTTGSSRIDFSGALADTLLLNGSGNISVTGDLNSVTSISVTSTTGDVDITGAVASTGTSRNTFNLAPDRVSLQASGDINTGGSVTSLTSTSVVAGGSVTVGGVGIGGGVTAFFGNNQTDSVTVTAGALDTIDVLAISGGYTKTVSGGTLNVAAGITGAVQGTTITGSLFNTGNLSTGGALTINAAGAYAPVAQIALSGTNSVTINAPDGIDLVSSGSTLSAPSVNLTASGGDIAAGLTGTTNITANTGGKFSLSSNFALTNLNITADGTVAGAGAGSSVQGSGGAQLMDFLSAGGQLALGMQSATGLANRYTESSQSITDIAISTTGTFGASGASSINVSAPLANISTPSVAIGSGSLTLSTAGDIMLTSVTTGGGSVNVFSSAGAVDLASVSTGGGSVTARTAGDATRDVTVQSVVTLGGNVTLTADNGSVLRAGAQALQIDSRNGQGLASGTTTLNAASGSVGTVGNSLLTSGAVTLNVNARNTIAVDVADTALTNLAVTTAASGSGTISVTNSNFAGLGITRIGGVDLNLAALSPLAAGAFALTATDGNIVVGGDIGNLTSLSLNAGRGFNASGDLRIQATGGPRSVNVEAYDLQSGRDVVISAGATAGDNVSVVQQVAASGNASVRAGRDIVLTADGGSALLSQSAVFNSQTLNAGRDLRVIGGSAAGVTGASAAVTAAGSQNLTANNDMVIQAGASDGAAARITSTRSQSGGAFSNISVLGGGDNAFAQLFAGTSQSFTQVTGAIAVQGGSGAGAFAEIVASTSSQSLGSSRGFGFTDLVLVQGGTGSGTYASLRAGTTQDIQSSGDIRVLGSSGTNSHAEIVAGTSQTIGSTSTPSFFTFNDPTAAILVQAGSAGTARILAGGTQTVLAAEGISVLGGSEAGMTARIETTGGGQTIGSSSTSFNDATADILVRGGTGQDAFASIKATGNQNINTGETISVLGGSGVGAFAEIFSSAGGQTVGSTSTSTNSNDPTGSILVRAGSGGIARVLAQNSQTILSGADLSVIGGDSAGLTASIESVAGSQTIGQTGLFSNDPSGSILVQAGTASGTAAWIRAASGQTIDAGGTIVLAGSGAGSFAEITTTVGTQTIGNVNNSSDQTDSISLTGGLAAGSYARISTGGNQNLRTSTDLSLIAGVGSGSGAVLASGTGQSLTVFGNLAMTGGSGTAPGANETAIRTGGSQSLSVSGNLTLTGGGFGSDTWIKQGGAGSQFINVGDDLSLLAPAATPGTGVTSIEASAGGQVINVGGAMDIDNQGGWLAYVASGGSQTISADTLNVSLSSTNGSNPFAGLSASGDQAITLEGDRATAGTATLSVRNLSNAAGSLAGVSTSGNLSILMDYDAAGLVAIGDVNAQGATKVSAGGDLSMVAGSLLIQGGSVPGSDARVLAGDQPPNAPTNTMLISTLFGPVELRGGAAGGAYIDPLQLDIVSSNSVLMQAGGSATANTSITAGTFNLAATAGDLSLINSTTSAATSSITAGVFNLFGSGNLNLLGGTIAVSDPSILSTVTIPGLCNGCSTNLLPFDRFNVQAFIPPPTDFGAAVALDILALSDLSIDIYDLVFDEDGNALLTRRRLNQCY